MAFPRVLVLMLTPARALLQEEQRLIPARVSFNFKVNLLGDYPEPKNEARKKLYPAIKKNVLEILEHYKDAEVSYLGDDDCAKLIEEGHSAAFATAYNTTNKSIHTSDICRLFQLKEKGGWYFDNDMVAIQDVREFVPPQASFVSARAGGGRTLFNSIIGVAPRHPIIQRAIDCVWRRYKDKIQESPGNFKERDEPLPRGIGFECFTAQFIAQLKGKARVPCKKGRGDPWCVGAHAYNDQPEGYETIYLFSETGSSKDEAERYGLLNKEKGLDAWFVGDESSHKPLFWSRLLEISPNRILRHSVNNPRRAVIEEEMDELEEHYFHLFNIE